MWRARAGNLRRLVGGGGREVSRSRWIVELRVDGKSLRVGLVVGRDPVWGRNNCHTLLSSLI